MQTNNEAKHIDINPNICGGRPCVTGTRIRVQDIYVCHELRGMTPDHILVAYPTLSLAAIYAAMAYFHDHRDEIRKQMHEEREFVDELKRRSCPGPLETLIGRDSNAPLSSR